MKTMTEFVGSHLARWNQEIAALVAQNKTPEEIDAWLTETQKLEGDKLGVLKTALTIQKERAEGLKRVIFMTKTEEEKLPEGVYQKNEHYYRLEFFPAAAGASTKGRADNSRGGRRDGRGNSRGGPRGNDRGGAKFGDRSTSGERSGEPNRFPSGPRAERSDRPARAPRPPRMDGSSNADGSPLSPPRRSAEPWVAPEVNTGPRNLKALDGTSLELKPITKEMLQFLTTPPKREPRPKRTDRKPRRTPDPAVEGVTAAPSGLDMSARLKLAAPPTAATEPTTSPESTLPPPVEAQPSASAET